jgi:hypothetical protein
MHPFDAEAGDTPFQKKNGDMSRENHLKMLR